jgi:serine/threonine protein phosphatase 1
MKIPSTWRGRQSSSSGSPGKRVYAVGDVHGRLDLLQELVGLIEDDNAGRPEMDVRLIFLGDVIDRGPDSRGVLDYLRHDVARRFQCHFVMGNHEEILVRALSNEPRLVLPWLHQGGYAFAESYGIPRNELEGVHQLDVLAMLRASVPEDDIGFLADFLDYIRFGSYIFVHAGIRPGLPLARQRPADMHWIREPFLSSRKNQGFIVVHGHTVNREIVVRPNRICLDTGAYRNNKLSAMMIDGDERIFIQAGFKE